MPRPASHTPLTRLAAVADAAVRDLGHRAREAAAVVRHRFGDAPPADAPPDEIVLARVRAMVDRTVARPEGVDTDVDGGHLVLAGTVLASEHASLLAAARRVRGVRRVDARLAVVPGIEGRPARRGSRLGARRQPAASLRDPRAAAALVAAAAALAGAALAVAALRRGLRRLDG